MANRVAGFNRQYIVDRSYNDPFTGCWEWLLSIDPSGYGNAAINCRKIGAHRLSYIVFVGEILKGLNICHTCDNRKCVNPDHLWAGTQGDNIRDCVRKGRLNHLFKVTHEVVAQIQSSKDKVSDLAIKYGLSESYIYNIKRRKYYG